MLSLSNESLSPAVSSRRARASVATHTLAAPAFRSACAAARAVAPVVRMSSTSSTCLPLTACASETENAPRRFMRLSCGKARLAIRGPQPHQSLRCQPQPPRRARPAQLAQRTLGQRPRLVETALGIFRSMQRHRHHQHLRRRIARQFGHRRRQHPAQPARRRPQPPILQRVDRGAHPPLVDPVSHRPLKRRGRHAATAAQLTRNGRHTTGAGEEQAVAAAHAHSPALARKLRPADGTDWHRRKLRQQRAAKRTGGRKERATEGVHGTSQHACHSAPPGSSRWNHVERQ